ncbi:MAG: FimB/Mfa2 family fimbrial subunit [Tannerellaceae bacterium]|nr:FimB/Mfa2 family fimbrial subunit [Tannerellaceae bacterium]
MLTLLASCASNEVVEPDIPPKPAPDDKGTVTLYFRHSDAPATTRALDEVLESTIDNIDVLAFEASGSTQNYAYRRTVDKNDIRDDPSDFSKKHFTIEVPKDQKRYKFVILANARSETGAYFSPGVDHSGEEKEYLLSHIVSSTTGFWDTNPASFKRLPMSGETDGVQTIDAINNQVIYLYRSLAVIDVKVDANVPFDLRKVYVYNRPTNGRVAPTSAYYNAAQKRFASPSLPATLNVVDKIMDGAMPSAIVSLDASTNEIADDIFLYETDKQGSEHFLYATCLVLGGYANGQTAMSYYRVDFADYRDLPTGTTPPPWSQGPPASGSGTGGMVGSGDTYYPLLRNHRYDIKVTGVNGQGSVDPLIASQTQHSQLITEFTTWNNQNKNIYIDNNPYVLNIDKGSVNLKTMSTDYIQVSTTFPGTWAVGNKSDDWFDCVVTGSTQSASVMVNLQRIPTAPAVGFFKIKLMKGTREIVSQLIKVEYK